MQVFDLHCHPTLKPMLSLPQKRVTPWEEIDNILNKIFDSQSNCKQLLQGGCNVACVGLSAIETAFLKDWIVKVASGPVRYIDRDQVENIANAAAGATYEDIMEQEINSIINHPVLSGTNGMKVKWINSVNDYDKNDMTTLHLIATQEGGHGLYYGSNEDNDINKILDRVKELKKASPVRLFYVTLTHISQNVFANHCYAIKVLPKRRFFPQTNGISNDGYKVIEALLSEENGKPILIDIKHLSLASRIEFYSKYNHRPIIASHAAVTGCSYKNKPIFKIRKKNNHDVYKVKYTRQRGYFPGTFFNPDSINLYDEDIKEIIKSNGIIGLILDERVLGFSKRPTSKEFISDLEWSKFISPDEIRHMKELTPEEDLLDDLEDEKEESEEEMLLAGHGPKRSKQFEELHLLHLLNNIIHIIMIGKNMGVDASKHITIGSDFDGLINAVDCCLFASEYSDLRKKLKETILEQSAAKIMIPNVDSFLDDFFYNNGVNFLMKNFK
ncbi:hypothetical protein E9993_15335 [Labilibacter sediminis]|nr:hypothetical protein E9993_15335 [Labilibacter sediminis]